MLCKDSSLPPYTINGILSRIRFLSELCLLVTILSMLCVQILKSNIHLVIKSYIFFSNVSCIGYILISTVRIIPDFLHYLHNLWLLSLLISICLLKNYPNYLPKILPSYYSISQKLQFHLQFEAESLSIKPWNSQPLPTAPTLPFQFNYLQNKTLHQPSWQDRPSKF